MVYVEIIEPTHVHFERRCLITMSEYGFHTVTLLPIPDSKKREEFIVHTSMVTSTVPKPDDMEYYDEFSLQVNEEGFVIGLNDIDSHGNERTRVSTNICLGREFAYDNQGRVMVDEEGNVLYYNQVYDSDNNIRAEYEVVWETDYPPGNENHVNENGEPFGLYDFVDRHGNPIRNSSSESSESESSNSETTNKKRKV